MYINFIRQLQKKHKVYSEKDRDKQTDTNRDRHAQRHTDRLMNTLNFFPNKIVFYNGITLSSSFMYNLTSIVHAIQGGLVLSNMTPCRVGGMVFLRMSQSTWVY